MLQREPRPGDIIYDTSAKIIKTIVSMICSARNSGTYAVGDNIYDFNTICNGELKQFVVISYTFNRYFTIINDV